MGNSDTATLQLQVAELRSRTSRTWTPAEVMVLVDYAVPGYVLTAQDICILLAVANGHAGDVVSAVAPDRVPAEISGAWYEARVLGESVRAIRDYLRSSDPDSNFALSYA